MPEQISRKLYNWASILEPQTREQAEKAASMPFAFPHLALMPDAHLEGGRPARPSPPADWPSS